MNTHKISWWVWNDMQTPQVLIRRTRHMIGRWGYEATCTCGWKTRTGGAIKAYIQREIQLHKIIGHNDIEEMEVTA